MKKLITITAVLTLLLSVVAANAALMAELTLQSGADTLTITDTDGDGLITFNSLIDGPFGEWNLTIVGAYTKPFPGQGNPALPIMHLSVQANTAQNAEQNLTVSFSDGGFTPVIDPQRSYRADIGGTLATEAVVDSYNTYADSDNMLPADALTLMEMGPYTGTGFMGFFGDVAYTTEHPDDAPYSLTQIVSLTHTKAGTTSFDAVLTVPDGGSTLMLLGSALALLGFMRSRKK